jgi:hypothetical protein
VNTVVSIFDGLTYDIIQFLGFRNKLAMEAERFFQSEHRLPQLRWLVVLFAVSSFCCGCSNRLATYPVKGQLKFEDGSVVKFGEIEFYNAEHRINARGKINRDGSFTVSTFQEGDGAVAGTHQVVIMQHLMTPLVARAATESKVNHDHGRLIHQQYNDYRTSELECTIQAGENIFEWTLKENPRQTETGLPQDSSLSEN